MNNNQIYIGPPGSGKTYAAKKQIIEIIWEHMTEEERTALDSRYYNPANFSERAFNYVASHYVPGICILSLHDGMTVSDFVEGITVVEHEDGIAFQNEPKSVLQLVSAMNNAPGRPAFLLLDDTHRLNVASALGELLFAFTHRGERVTMPSGHTLVIPEELYVFMTYNTLRPDYRLDVGLLSSFSIISTNSTCEQLTEAVQDSFYKDAYFNIDSQLINEFNRGLAQWNGLISRYTETEQGRPSIINMQGILERVPSFLQCPTAEEAERFASLSCPLVWNDDDAIRFKGQFNSLGKTLLNCINDIHELYSQFYSPQTVTLLSSFLREIEENYRYYNQFLDFIVPEYRNDYDKYIIGYTYFLPGLGYSMWNARKLLQNKIRSQVLPLLRQYRKEGVILCDTIPDIERTATQYTRERTEVEEETIFIRENEAYRQIFIDSFQQRQSAGTFRQQGGQKYNSNYGVLFELLVDIISHPLINNWEIMDILLYDREIYFKLDESCSWGSCLLCSSDLSSSVVLGASDTTAGNNNGVYRSDLHAVFYKGKKYYMVSKIKTESRARFLSIEECKQRRSVRREISLYGMAKLLAYKYLLRYKENLLAYRSELLDVEEIRLINSEIALIGEDLAALDQMHLRGTNNDDLRWNLLADIKALPTWQKMINGTIRGAYKKMDSRYQAIMDSTGIHQMILQGPPGTSKTYGAKQFLAEQANLVTDGVWSEAELKKRQLVTQGEEYVLPTEGINETDNVFWDIIQFHPSYTYEDFVRGIAVSTSEGGTATVFGSIKEGDAEKYTLTLHQPVSVSYRTVNRTLGKMAQIAKRYYNAENPENSKKFYLVIDEINRANLATVFGELIYALEYRDSEVSTPYAVRNEARLQIPNNLYIVGTMNTADKSISSIDYAIRRRFLFFHVLPDITVIYSKVGAVGIAAKEIRLFHAVERFFDVYMNTDDYSRSDVQIGHTYFLRKGNDDSADEQMKNRFLFQVVPVLQEYSNDGILMPDVYGTDPHTYELEVMDIIKQMIESSDINTLDGLYDQLISKLEKEEYSNAIREELAERNIAVE